MQLASQWEGLSNRQNGTQRAREQLLEEILGLNTTFFLINDRFSLTDEDFDKMQSSIKSFINYSALNHQNPRISDALAFHDFIFDLETRNYLVAHCHGKLYKMPKPVKDLINKALEDKALVVALLNLMSANMKAFAKASEAFMQDNITRF